MIRRKIRRRDLDKAPYLLWNAYIDLLAMESYESLSQVQRIPHLCFWYDSEVQNGGHLQYFENGKLKHLDQTLDSLKLLGSEFLEQLLRRASIQWLSKNRTPISLTEQYVHAALKGEFDEFDTAFCQCKPSITDLLKQYLEKYKAEFVEIK